MSSNPSQTNSPSQWSSNASEIEAHSNRNSKVNSLRYRPSPTRKSKRSIEFTDSDESELTILDSDNDGNGSDRLSELSDEDNGTPNPSVKLETLTRRQKAKYLEDYQVEFLELPTESKKSKLTPEEIESRKAELSRRRRHQSQQRAEEEKNAVISRLLKKQATKKSKKDKDIATDTPEFTLPPTSVRYRNYENGLALLSFPEGVEMQLDSSQPKKPSKPLKCQVKGCKQPKKYCNSKNQKLSCSYDHYKLLL